MLNISFWDQGSRQEAGSWERAFTVPRDGDTVCLDRPGGGTWWWKVVGTASWSSPATVSVNVVDE